MWLLCHGLRVERNPGELMCLQEVTDGFEVTGGEGRERSSVEGGEGRGRLKLVGSEGGSRS